MRKYYLDNTRYIVVLLVVVYHILLVFNSVGVLANINIPGYPILDLFEYMIYPWFMVVLFIISGISARASLEKGRKVGKTYKQFLRRKVKTILLPSIVCIFLFGWISGWVTLQYNDIFMGQGEKIPLLFKYFILSFIGMGPVWFLHQLMVCFLVLGLVLKLDKGDKVYGIFSKINLWVLLLGFLVLWSFSKVGNLPLIEVYRNGIYICAFFMGYWIFSQERTEELLCKHSYLFIGLGLLFAGIYIMKNFGESYTQAKSLSSLLTNLFAWFGSLGILSLMKKFFFQYTLFTKFMEERSFSYYILHYPLICILAYFLHKYFIFPKWAMYILLLILTMIFLTLVSYLVRKSYILSRVLLGNFK